MKSEPGTYVFIGRCNRPRTIEVCRWGELTLKPGFYLYVGSAFGQGGVRARVLRHWRGDGQCHWHIDYVCPSLVPVTAWCAYQDRELAHDWALELADRFDPVYEFGCTDCQCVSHLFYSTCFPDRREIANAFSSAETFNLDQIDGLYP